MKTKIGEYAIVINSKNEFLMLELAPDKWHFPGGRLDEGEEAVQGVIWEVKEETNLDIFDVKPVFTKIFTKEDKYGVFFIARVKEPYSVVIDDEHVRFKWFKKEEIDTIPLWQSFYKTLLEENV